MTNPLLPVSFISYKDFNFASKGLEMEQNQFWDLNSWITSYCFIRMASLSQRCVFRMVSRVSHGVDTLMNGPVYVSPRDESVEGESPK